MESKNEYESERARRIAQNHMRMKCMGLLETAQEAMLAARTSKATMGMKRALSSTEDAEARPVALRRSTRGQTSEELSCLPNDHDDVHAPKRVREPPRASCSKGAEEDYDEYNKYRYGTKYSTPGGLLIVIHRRFAGAPSSSLNSNNAAISDSGP